MGQRAPILLRRLVAACVCAALAGCGGFGTSNITSPGSTPNMAAQNVFRFVGQVGTPFNCLISDTRSSWNVKGVVPLTMIIVNNSPPVRISATKTVSDQSILSLQMITGFSTILLASTHDHFGLVVGSSTIGSAGTLAFAPAANPDVRFFVKGPNAEIFNALIEDQTTAFIVQSQAPTVILFDSPNSTRVDGIFTAVTFDGPFQIDMLRGGKLVDFAVGGTSATLNNP